MFFCIRCGELCNVVVDGDTVFRTGFRRLNNNEDIPMGVCKSCVLNSCEELAQELDNDHDTRTSQVTEHVSPFQSFCLKNL